MERNIEPKIWPNLLHSYSPPVIIKFCTQQFNGFILAGTSREKGVPKNTTSKFPLQLDAYILVGCSTELKTKRKETREQFLKILCQPKFPKFKPQSCVFRPQTSHNIDCFCGFFLPYTDCVAFELVDSAALLWSNSCGGGGQIVFLNLTTIILMAAVSTIHDVTGRRLVRAIYL
jgi:hypothetical protein